MTGASLKASRLAAMSRPWPAIAFKWASTRMDALNPNAEMLLAIRRTCFAPCRRALPGSGFSAESATVSTASRGGGFAPAADRPLARMGLFRFAWPNMRENEARPGGFCRNKQIRVPLILIRPPPPAGRSPLQWHASQPSQACARVP